jgi:hypothetical protein
MVVTHCRCWSIRHDLRQEELAEIKVELESVAECTTEVKGHRENKWSFVLIIVCEHRM